MSTSTPKKKCCSSSLFASYRLKQNVLEKDGFRKCFLFSCVVRFVCPFHSRPEVAMEAMEQSGQMPKSKLPCHIRFLRVFFLLKAFTSCFQAEQTLPCGMWFADLGKDVLFACLWSIPSTLLHPFCFVPSLPIFPVFHIPVMVVHGCIPLCVMQMLAFWI